MLRTATDFFAPRTADAVTWRHWVLLAASLWTTAAGSTIVMGAAFLLPTLHTDLGLSLAHAGLVVAMPQVGILTALIAWGYVVDRVGERFVLVAGLTVTTAAVAGAMVSGSLWLIAAFFFLAGGGAASTNSASGRVVVGWFPAHRRGLAMGVRQMSTPLGAAIGAMTMPVLAQRHGLAAALAVPALACAVGIVTTLLLVADPDRPARTARGADGLAANPYVGVDYLWRIHGVSLLLVIPQTLMSAFTLVWLMAGHGWSAAAAGAVVTVGQLLGAAGRIVAGAWSDRLGSRMRPLRIVAIAAALTAVALAVSEGMGAYGLAVAVAIAIALTVVSVADNGLAFTAVAEYAGPFWSGRALGMQNTSQFIAMATVTPAFGYLIERAGYAWAFAATALVAAVAVPLVPRADRAR